MQLGFTGTRNGQTNEQAAAFLDFVRRRQPTVFHQGCCDGADENATVIVHNHRQEWGGCRIIGHPGKSARGGVNENRSKLAVSLCDKVMPEDSHFSRNRRIVRESDEVVATPWQTMDQEPGEGQGGGTWYTVQHAVKVGKRVTIIWPNGIVETR